MIMERLKTERHIPDERIISCRYDSMEYVDLTAKDMYDQLKSRLSTEGKTYLFLDEVQEIEGWERVVNSLASDFDVDLYVTGSNSRMMSSEIATYLTGRYISFRIFTLSFGEYLMFKRQYAPVSDVKTELANYVRLGGFPATHLQAYSQEEVYTIVRDIYNSTIFPTSSAAVKSENRPVGTYRQIHLQQCRQHLLREVHCRLSEIGASFVGQRNSLQLLGEARKGVPAAPLHPL